MTEKAKKRNKTDSEETSTVPAKKQKFDSSVASEEKPKKKFSKPDKPFAKKTNSFKNNNSNDKTNGAAKPGEKTDWIEFKKKKKELLLKRKQNNKLYDVTVQAKKLGEKLRCKTLKGGDAERKELCKELHKLLGNQGNYPKFVLTHDMARIVQCLFKHATPEMRHEIATELIPVTMQMLDSKYAKNCVKAILKYGDAGARSATIRAFYGSAVRICSHVLSAPIFEYAYTNFASNQEKQYLAQEFYGDMYKQSKDKDVRSLKDVFVQSPEMKTAALGATKANLQTILNKNLFDNALVHTVLYQFLSECSTEDKAEMITQLASHVVIMSNSKDGVRAAMQCFWFGTNKDKKTAIKSLKEHVVELSKHEHGHNLIITLLDTTDDTVLINKAILSEILKDVQQVAKDEWGRKVLLWLLAPANSKYFHPAFLQDLESSRQISTSKKDPEIRRKELLKYVSGPLLDNVIESPDFWLHEASIAIVTLNVVSSAAAAAAAPKESEEKLVQVLDALCSVVTRSDWTLTEKHKAKDGTETASEVPGIEHAGLHMVLKNLAKHDKEVMVVGDGAKRTDLCFGNAVTGKLTDEIVQKWLSSNRGCFLLLNIFENNVEDVQNRLKELVRPHRKMLKKSSAAGAKILYKKLEL